MLKRFQRRLGQLYGSLMTQLQNSSNSILPLSSESNFLKRDIQNFLSAEIPTLASMAINSSRVIQPDPSKSNCLKSSLRMNSSYELFDNLSRHCLRVLVRYSICCLLTCDESSSTMHHTLSIILTKYSSLGRLMERSVQ